MARKPTLPQLTTWTIYKVAAKQTRLGEVQAADEREAIEKAAAEFRQHPSKLMAVPRRYFHPRPHLPVGIHTVQGRRIEVVPPADALRVALMMLARRGRLESGDVLKVTAPN